MLDVCKISCSLGSHQIANASVQISNLTMFMVGLFFGLELLD